MMRMNIDATKNRLVNGLPIRANVGDDVGGAVVAEDVGGTGDRGYRRKYPIFSDHDNPFHTLPSSQH